MSEQEPNKRESGISRVVGVEPDVEQKVLDHFAEILQTLRVDASESPKSPELRDLITRLNDEMNTFLVRYGAEPIDFGPDHVHVLNWEALPPEIADAVREHYKDTPGSYIPERQGINMTIDYETQKLRFAQTMAHELVHAHSFQTMHRVRTRSNLTVQDASERGHEPVFLNMRRIGVQIYTTSGKNEFVFHDLNEALTTEIARRFDLEVFGRIPELADEYNARERSIAASPPEKREGYVFDIAQVSQGPDGMYEAYTWSYTKERHELARLIQALYEHNSDQFGSPEDVFTLIATSAMTGRLLSFARLVERTFGKGSFRQIGTDTR